MSRQYHQSLIATALVLLSVGIVSAQGPDTLWARTYGGAGADYGSSISQATEGGYIIAGSTTSFGSGGSDLYVVRTDANGDTLWTRTYGGANDDRGSLIDGTHDGGYIVAGTTRSFGAGEDDFYLVRIDSVGDTLWTRTYGGSDWDRVGAAQETSDRGYIVVGWTGPEGAVSKGKTDEDIYIVRTDGDGDTLWTRTYGGPGDDEARSVCQTTDEGFVITGWTTSLGGNSLVYLMRTDADGDTLWAHVYGGSNTDLGRSVRQTLDGGYIITGSTESFGSGMTDVLLIRTDAIGDSVWMRVYGGSNLDFGHSVYQTADDGFVIVGATSSFGAGSADVYLIRTDVNGDSLWTSVFGGSGLDEGLSVLETSNRSYVVAGMTNSSGMGYYDVLLLETECDPVAAINNEPSFRRSLELQAIPNPCSKGAMVKYGLCIPGWILVAVYDITGREINELANTVRSTGTHYIPWDGTDSHGNAAPPGIYFIRLQAGDQVATEKVVLIR